MARSATTGLSVDTWMEKSVSLMESFASTVFLENGAMVKGACGLAPLDVMYVSVMVAGVGLGFWMSTKVLKPQAEVPSAR